VKAGSLRHRITIQSKSAGSPQQFPSGEPDESWSDYATSLPAEWITLSGNALFAAQQHHSEVRGIWRIRWKDGVTNRMRIVHNGLYYNILFVPPFDKSGKSWQMDLEVSQGVDEG
jgi:SPP1 family predicted phage head-tail adaptor